MLITLSASGTVLTIQCTRIMDNGDSFVKWEKKVFVPSKDLAQCYAKYHLNKVGAFKYMIDDKVDIVARKPKNVPLWTE